MIELAIDPKIENVWTLIYEIIEVGTNEPEVRINILHFSDNVMTGYDQRGTAKHCTLHEETVDGEARTVTSVTIERVGTFEVFNPKFIFDYK